MDIQRKDLARKQKIRRVLYFAVALLAMGAITYGVSKLEPAAPTVEASVVFPDTVERGDMTIDVRGLGTLVPEEIVLIPARDEGRVERRYLQAGMAVEPDTVLIELSNPSSIKPCSTCRPRLRPPRPSTPTSKCNSRRSGSTKRPRRRKCAANTRRRRRSMRSTRSCTTRAYPVTLAHHNGAARHAGQD
ncbi:MAG: efflux RND transporter periplasmic adaptor subunit [Bryobacterales bacterium]